MTMAAANPYIEAETGVTVGIFDLAPPANLLAWISDESIIEISTEWVLIPSLIVLAIIVGFLPAIAAYRTDVAEALSANP